MIWMVAVLACTDTKDGTFGGGSRDPEPSDGTGTTTPTDVEEDGTRDDDATGPPDDSGTDTGTDGTAVTGTVPDSLPPECDPTIVGAALPDLIPCAMGRAWPNFYVYFCNASTGEGGEPYQVRIENEATGQRYDSNPIYPYAVPPSGVCWKTGGFNCWLIGDADCTATITIRATTDPYDRLTESDELDNEVVVSF